MPDKARLDQLLVDQAHADSRSKAQALIMSGNVLVNDVPVTKAGQMINISAVIRIKGKEHPWVSRGGLKLAKAIEHYCLISIWALEFVYL